MSAVPVEQAVSIENSFRTQFQTMYPHKQDVIHRLNLADYDLARKRLTELKKTYE